MLCLVAALPCEARPLVEHYGLRAVPAQGFTVYEGEEMALIVSGVGKVAAAAAVSYLQLHIGRAGPHGWLNCGVAGHPRRAVGEGILAHRIIDAAGGRSWYPPLIEPSPCATDVLVCVDRPERYFPQACAYDMEAAGFYPTACRFSTSEVVQCYKVISDGHAEAGAPLPARRVTRLMEGHLDVIAAVARSLESMARQLAEVRSPTDLEDRCLGGRHFTRTQRHQLARACRRAHLMGLDGEALLAELDGCPRAADVLRHLHGVLDAAVPRLP